MFCSYAEIAKNCYVHLPQFLILKALCDNAYDPASLLDSVEDAINATIPLRNQWPAHNQS